MGDQRRAGERGTTWAREKERTDCVASDRRVFGITGDWSTAALDLVFWYNSVCEGGCRFKAATTRQDERCPKSDRQRKKERDAEEADKVEVEVAPGVTVGRLRRFKAALIEPIQGLPKRRRLHR